MVTVCQIVIHLLVSLLTAAQRLVVEDLLPHLRLRHLLHAILTVYANTERAPVPVLVIVAATHLHHHQLPHALQANIGMGHHA